MTDESQPPPQLISPFEDAVRRDKSHEEHHHHHHPHTLLNRLPHQTTDKPTAATLTVETITNETTSATASANTHPLLLRARLKTKRQFQNSPLLSEQEFIFPRFSVNELNLGRVLGRGGFGTVLEVVRFDLHRDWNRDWSGDGDAAGVNLHLNGVGHTDTEEENHWNHEVVRQVKSMDALGHHHSPPATTTTSSPTNIIETNGSSLELKTKRKRSISLGFGRHDFFKRGHNHHQKHGHRGVESQSSSALCWNKSPTVAAATSAAAATICKETIIESNKENVNVVAENGALSAKDERPSLQGIKHQQHQTSLNFSFVSWRDSMPGQEGRDAVDESDLSHLCYEYVDEEKDTPVGSSRLKQMNETGELLEPNITEEDEHEHKMIENSTDAKKDVAQADDSSPSTPNSSNHNLLPPPTTNNPSPPSPPRRRIVLFSNNHNTNNSFDLNTSLRPNILQDKRFLSQHVITSKGQSRYVVKIISPHIVRGDFTRFLQAASDMATETYFLSVLNHSHILKMRAVGQGDMFSPSYFIVMDRLYETLSDKISGEWKKRADHLENDFLVWNRRWKRECLWGERVGVAKDLAGALGYLHDMCVIYRDLKPENIGFDSRGVAKLFDFGLAKQVRHEDAQDGAYRLTANTGSLRYMSPECGNGWPYNFSTDSYSFTILLWEILALELPFKHYTAQEIVNMVRKWGERPKLKEEWSDRLKTSLSNGWHSNFRQRPTMKDFETILDLELHESHAA